MAKKQLFGSRQVEARVEINADKTQASLILKRETADARSLNMKDINLALKESALGGIDAEEIKAAVSTFIEGDDLDFSYVLAEGIPPARGKDRLVEVVVNKLPAQTSIPVFDRVKSWHGRSLLSEEDLEPVKGMSFAFIKADEPVARVSDSSQGEEGTDIFGKPVPGLLGNDPDIKLYQGLKLDGSEIKASMEGLLYFEAAEKSFRGKVIDYRDARIIVRVSKDIMEAKGDFFREEGAGIPLTIENIQKVLTALGVRKGIDWDCLKNACVRARAEGSVLGCVFARGLPPVAAGGHAYKWLVPLSIPLPGADSADSEDGAVIQVKAGTPIVELSEPLPEGRPGCDIKGNNIPSEKGMDLDIDHDKSINVARLDKRLRLIAARSGDLSFDGEKLRINPLRSIKGDVAEVIKFTGEVQVGGNLLPGCVIMGESHITVSGFAEEAVVFTEGRAVISKGFKGGGKGSLRARAGIVSAFVERASVMAVGDIQLNKGSILSNIKTNGKLTITGNNGKLAGGICQARAGIDAADVGSENGIRTEISFGQDYFLKEDLNVCEEEVAKSEWLLQKINEEVNEALKNKKPIPEHVRKEKVRLVKLLEQLKIRDFTLREKFEEHFDSEITVRGYVFPGVVIESHNRYYEVKQKRKNVVFYFDRKSGRIGERQLVQSKK